jgi:photosystem II stability/assembly factor-like uncharacterized protein
MRHLALLAATLGALSAGAPPPSPALLWTPQQSGVTARLRGVSAVSAQIAWASGARGTVLRTTDGGATWQTRPVPGAASLDFRDIEAFDAQTAYALSIGSGEQSRIYHTGDGGGTWTLQFQNTDPKAFLDDMKFGVDNARTTGIAYSDSVDGRTVMFRTTDGRQWARVASESLPAAVANEGAFAASGTNIAVRGRHVWVGTNASRVLRSDDGGRTWRVSATPLPTGSSTGIFSIAFRDARHGVVVGGDYSREADAIDNAAVSSDGGVTWSLARSLSGYRSVVAWLEGAGPSTWLAIGPSGADLSEDDGRTWKAVASEGYDTFSAAPGARTGWAAGNGGRIARVSW